MDNKFIYTTSKETAEVLRKMGFIEVTQPNVSGWTFINNDNIKFSLNDSTVYTNKLFI